MRLYEPVALRGRSPYGAEPEPEAVFPAYRQAGALEWANFFMGGTES